MDIHITGLENDLWEPIIGPSINPEPPTSYFIQHTAAGLYLIMCSDVPYGGWLAKNVAPLLEEAPLITFKYTLLVDAATEGFAQVEETDFKVTDSEGWTYDLSAQWVIARGWIFQVDNEEWTWRDTNVQIEPLSSEEAAEIEIAAEIDYEAHTSSILSVSVNGVVYDVDPPYSIPAKQEGWAKSEIVTQLQQCNNEKPGGYASLFSDIGYVLRS